MDFGLDEPPANPPAKWVYPKRPAKGFPYSFSWTEEEFVVEHMEESPSLQNLQVPHLH